MNDNKFLVAMALVGALTIASIAIFSPNLLDSESTKKHKEEEITKREVEKTKQLQYQWKCDSLKSIKK